jgi:hypothetical protein
MGKAVDQSVPKQSASQIVILGPRATGKTTYLSGLTALAELKSDFLLNKDHIKVELEAVINNPNSKQLAEDAYNKLFSQAPFQRTDKDKIITYRFRGEISYKKYIDEFIVSATDFPGEGLETINVLGSRQRKEIEERVSERNVRLLILLADWERTETGKTSSQALDDSQLASKLTELRQIIQSTNNENAKNFRFAIVMSKCERGELWTNRIDPLEDIFKRYLPSSTKVIQRIFNDFKIPQTNLEFFAMSTFGVLGVNDFRPNRNDFIMVSGDRDSVLRDTAPDRWHPYGMLSPIYWLTTGRRLPPHV